MGQAPALVQWERGHGRDIVRRHRGHDSGIWWRREGRRQRLRAAGHLQGSGTLGQPQARLAHV